MNGPRASPNEDERLRNEKSTNLQEPKSQGRIDKKSLQNKPESTLIADKPVMFTNVYFPSIWCSVSTK